MAPRMSGKCKCGAVQIALDQAPFMTYYCHCSHCRGFASKFLKSPAPYHGGAAVWRWNVDIQGHLEYEHTTSLGGLFAMSRGRCAACKQPVVEKCERLVCAFAMVMTDLIEDLEPDTNIFYNSGVRKGPTVGGRTLCTDIGSLLYEVFIIAFMAIPLLPASLYRRVTRGKTTKSS